MSQPNFLILLTDDQGYGDAGCYGASELRTPNLDRLAREGARFTQWYGGAPICSASRAALLTGRRPARAGVPRNVPPAWEAPGLDARAATLPEALKPLGYQTFMAGKWHLGQGPGRRPHERGFDDWFGFLHGCVDYYSHIMYYLMAGARRPPRHDLWHNDAPLHLEGQYLTDLIADHAVRCLQRAAEDGRPFCLYVPFNAPHYPMHAPAEVMQRFEHLDQARRLTAAMLFAYDRAVGRILEKLDRLGLAQNTCVFASTDHGPSRENRNWPDGRTDPFPGGSTGGLRGAKSSLLEGGIRIPAVMRWPGVTAAGSVLDQPAGHIDILPTFLAAAGGEASDDDFDGLNIAPLIRDGRDSPHDHLFWSFHDQLAVRRGRWKLTLNASVPRGDAPPAPVHLCDLDADPAEANNLADAQPRLTADLKQRAEQWRQGVEQERQALEATAS